MSIQFMALGFKPQPLKHESSHITTRVVDIYLMKLA